MANEQKSWQARIAEATDALGRDFVESVSYDWRLYKQDVAGSLAHAAMLAKVGLITDADRAAIDRGLREIEAEIDRDGPAWPGFDKQYEDIHMCVEKALIDKVGEPGRRLHTGRSRNDQVATDLVLWLQDNTAAILGKLNDLEQALAAAAIRNSGKVMPCYTHLQRAQPIDAAAELLAWAKMVQIDYLRLDGFLGQDSALHSTFALGSGAIAGSTLPLDRRITQYALTHGNAPTDDELGESSRERLERLAREAGDETLEQMAPFLDAYPNDDNSAEWGLQQSNSLEATASRDAALDFVYACAMTAMHLSRWAEQWIIYSSAEFGFIRTADRYTTGSSMMPQKRNPDMLELIRGRCGNVYGSLVSLLVICKGLPIGYNRDLQEDKRHVFAAYDTVSSCLTMAAAVVNSTEFVAERCEAACEGGFMDATSLAEYLVVKGVPFRTAHQVVGGLVARCEREGKMKLSELSLEEFKAANDKIDEDVYDCLGARNVVSRYQSAGAAGGEPLKKQLAEWKQRLGL